MDEKNKKYAPGDGIRSLQSTSLFRAVNFELYVKPVNTYLCKNIRNFI